MGVRNRQAEVAGMPAGHIDVLALKGRPVTHAPIRRVSPHRPLEAPGVELGVGVGAGLRHHRDNQQKGDDESGSGSERSCQGSAS